MVVFLVCGICSVPWPGSWGDQVTGSEKGEVWQSLWALDHGKNAWFLGGDIGHAPNINPPKGENLYPHVPMGLAAIWAPITEIVALPIAYNLAAWLGLFLTFFCAYLLFWEISGDFWPGIIGGAAFTLAPYGIMEIGNGAITTGTPFVVPLAVFLLVRYLDKGTTLYGLLTVFSFSATILYHFTFGLILLVISLCASMVALFDEGPRAFLRGITATVAPVVLVLPLFSNIYSPDAPIFIDTAGPHLGLSGTLSSMGETSFIFPIIPFIGAVAGTFFIKNKRIFWWVLALVFLLFAFGKTILPFAADSTSLINIIPGVPAIYDPFRFTIGLQLALCAIFSMGIRKVLDRLEEKDKDESLVKRGIFMVVLVTAVILTPGDTVSPEIPTAYNAMYKEGTLLVLPSLSKTDVRKNLYFQTEHRHPVYLKENKVPGTDFPVSISEAYEEIRYCRKESRCEKLIMLKGEIKANQVRYVALHKQGVENLQTSPDYIALTKMFGNPIYAEKYLTLFYVD